MALNQARIFIMFALRIQTKWGPTHENIAPLKTPWGTFKFEGK